MIASIEINGRIVVLEAMDEKELMRKIRKATREAKKREERERMAHGRATENAYAIIGKAACQYADSGEWPKSWAWTRPEITSKAAGYTAVTVNNKNGYFQIETYNVPIKRVLENPAGALVLETADDRYAIGTAKIDGTDEPVYALVSWPGNMSLDSVREYGDRTEK